MIETYKGYIIEVSIDEPNICHVVTFKASSGRIIEQQLVYARGIATSAMTWAKRIIDSWIRPDTRLELRKQMAIARDLHPKPSFAALVEEVGEVAKAMQEEGPKRVKEELYQVAVVALRLIEEGE